MNLHVCIFLVLLKFIKATDPATLYLTTKSENITIGINRNEDKLKQDVPYKLILHGWTENANFSSYVKLAETYLNFGDYNIIRIDYSETTNLDYVRASNGIEAVGKFIAKFLTHLVLNLNVPPSNLHVIGHSMGAQVAGYIGKFFYNSTNSYLARITGLDAARPGFESLLWHNKLTLKDAEMVDLVHTDAGAYGYKNPLGSIDFYPNGGKRLQPNCKSLGGFDFIPNVDFLSSWVSPSDKFCSHLTSVTFFIESINRKIEASKCSSWELFNQDKCNESEKIIFGEHTTKANGVYYFKTAQEEPLLRIN